MGHFLAAIRIDQFMPLQQFTAAMDAFVESIQRSETTESQCSIEYPGSQEHKTMKQRVRAGVPIDDRLLEELRDLAKSLSIQSVG